MLPVHLLRGIPLACEEGIMLTNDLPLKERGQCRVFLKKALNDILLMGGTSELVDYVIALNKLVSYLSSSTFALNERSFRNCTRLKS